MIPRHQQPVLFGKQPPRSHHAKKLNPNAHRCRLIKEALRARELEGGTPSELATILGLCKAQVGPALSELREWGEAQKSEAIRKNETVWLAL